MTLRFRLSGGFVNGVEWFPVWVFLNGIPGCLLLLSAVVVCCGSSIRMGKEGERWIEGREEMSEAERGKSEERKRGREWGESESGGLYFSAQ